MRTNLRKRLVWLRRLLADESGPTSVEYAVMLALIIGIAITGIRTFSEASATSFNNSANQLQSFMGN